LRVIKKMMKKRVAPFRGLAGARRVIAARTLDTEYGTCKTVKIRFWPWR